MTEQANTTLEGLGSSLMPRLSAIKPSQHKSSYLQPMKFRTVTVTDIDGDGIDTVMDGPAQESKC